jgi:hypothetical protein
VYTLVFWLITLLPTHLFRFKGFFAAKATIMAKTGFFTISSTAFKLMEMSTDHMRLSMGVNKY